MRLIAALVMLWISFSTRADSTVKIAVLEPLSGPPAAVGKWWANHVQMAVDRLNASGGVLGGKHVEAVYFDTKASPQEALVVLKSVTDQGLRFVFGTAGSNVGIALSDAIAKYNARNPDATVLFLNYGSLTPEMTNEKCHYWHFRFDGNSDMKVHGLMRHLMSQKAVAKVYLLNEDYAYGQAVQKLMRELLPLRRPDIQIVGDELIPLQKTKDFAPYIAKMRASGADTILTSAWGPDFSLMVRASHEYGLSARYYAFNAHFIGTPAAIGEAGVERVVNVGDWHPNLADARLESYYTDYKRKYKEEWNMLPIKAAVEMWAKAVDAAGAADPARVARALEGMRHDSGTGPMWMRPDDHQIMQPLYAYAFAKVGPGVKHDVEDTGVGYRTEGRIEPESVVLPNVCKMERPAVPK